MRSIEPLNLDHFAEQFFRRAIRRHVEECMAHFMAWGEFRSYRGPDGLDPLAQAEPAWAPFLKETRGLYVHPVNDAVERLPTYLERVADWMEWIGCGQGLRR
jgi:hypothetical protein